MEEAEEGVLTGMQVVNIFRDFLHEENPELAAESPRQGHAATRPGSLGSHEELLTGEDGTGSDDGWETLQEHGPDAGGGREGDTDDAEKESLDDGQTSCSSFGIDLPSEVETKVSEDALGDARGSNRYQKRQKLELLYLRDKVHELEDKVRRIEQDNRAKLGDSMWKRMARQQAVARQQSVSENTKLKEELKEQIKFSKSLEKMIRKRSIFTNDTTNHPPRRRRKLTTVSFTNELRTSTAKEFLRLDRVMAASGAATIESDHHSVRVKSKRDPTSQHGDILRIEAVNARKFPFPFEAVAAVIWGFLSDASNLTKSEGISRKVECWSDGLLATTTLTFPVGERAAELNACAVFQKTADSESVVINWVSRGDCKAKRSTKNAFEVLEKGWTKIEGLPGNEVGCLLRTVNQFTPTMSSSEKEDTFRDQSESPLTDPEVSEENTNSEEIGILTEMIFGAYARAAGKIHTVVENVLMQQLVAGRAKVNE